MGEERPRRAPPSRRGLDKGGAVGLQLCPHVAGLDAHRGRHLQGRAGTQAPPRLAPAPSDPQPRPPRGAGPAHCRQTPHTPGTGPSGIQSRRPWCPQVHCLDGHAAPTCPGDAVESVPQSLTPRRGADGTLPSRQDLVLTPSCSGFWGGRGQSWNCTDRPPPAHAMPQTHVNAVLARLPGGPLGARGASRSHFLKWRNTIRRQGG